MSDLEYENRLGDALEQAMEAGADALPALAEGLNGLGVLSREGVRWTAASLESELHRLGEAARRWEKERTR